MSGEYKILITEPLPLIDIEREMLSKYGKVVVAGSANEDTLAELAVDADVIMVVYAKITRKIIESAKKLKGIVRYGIGVDNIDLGAATSKGVFVANVPDYCIGTVADFAFALILALVRRIIHADKYVREKAYLSRWTNPPEELRGIDLEGKTLGIIGLGKIGVEVAKRAIGFGMNVLAYDPYVTPEIAKRLNVKLVDLETLLRESDVISIHCPLTKETYHLIDENKLRLMRKTAYIVNTARGPIIDEKALYKALKEGWIAGAALDVYEREPLPSDSPLFELDNVILTPHIAWYTEEALKRLEMSAVEEAIRILKGELPRNLVNKELIKRTNA